jgi:hypothetical protein
MAADVFEEQADAWRAHESRIEQAQQGEDGSQWISK